jgi:hypothetical protein
MRALLPAGIAGTAEKLMSELPLITSAFGTTEVGQTRPSGGATLNPTGVRAGRCDERGHDDATTMRPEELPPETPLPQAQWAEETGNNDPY